MQVTINPDRKHNDAHPPDPATIPGNTEVINAIEKHSTANAALNRTWGHPVESKNACLVPDFWTELETLPFIKEFSAPPLLSPVP